MHPGHGTQAPLPLHAWSGVLAVQLAHVPPLPQAVSDETTQLPPLKHWPAGQTQAPTLHVRPVVVQSVHVPLVPQLLFAVPGSQV
jgi:hypothetical protein